MKRYFLFGLFVSAMILMAENVCAQAGVGQDLQRRFVSLQPVRRGMTRQEVATALGDKIVMGYELADLAGQQYKPLTVANPYRTETIKKGRKEFAVVYYLVGIKNSDAKITDDELEPLVFLNDKLIGTGWDFLNQKIKK